LSEVPGTIPQDRIRPAGIRFLRGFLLPGSPLRGFLLPGQKILSLFPKKPENGICLFEFIMLY
jgi:hypothetical protein